MIVLEPGNTNQKTELSLKERIVMYPELFCVRRSVLLQTNVITQWAKMGKPIILKFVHVLFFHS